jgi:hypothetical protein
MMQPVERRGTARDVALGVALGMGDLGGLHKEDSHGRVQSVVWERRGEEMGTSGRSS